MDRRRKKDKKINTWDGIRISEEGLRAEKEQRSKTLILKAVLVYLLVGGSMGCVLSALDVEYYPAVVQLVLFVASLFLVSLYYRKFWENLGYLLLFALMTILAYGLRFYINSGFYGVINTMAEEVSVYFDSNAMRSYGEKISNRPLAITISMCYIGIVCCIIVNVLISRRMKYILTMLVVMGMLFMPLYFELEPDLFYVVQLFTAWFLVASWHRAKHYALRKDNSKYEQKGTRIRYVYASRTVLQAGLLFTAIVLVLSTVMAFIAPKETYHKKHPTTEWKNRTKDTVETLAVMGIAGLFNYYPNTGGLTSGKLGGVSAIRLDYNTDLTLTFVPNSTERFYLKQFTGEEYLAGENRWSRGLDISEQTEVTVKWEYYNKNEHSGMGQIKVENVAGEAGVYLPYYSTDSNQIVLPGRSQTYRYFTIAQLGEDTPAVSERVDRWLAIPEVNQEVLDEISREADLHGTPEEIVEQLAEYFEEEIPYSYQPGNTPRGEDFVNYFLTKNRRGYCAHFASAATLLFRYMGIPARYVEGYAIDAADIAEEGKVLPNEQVEEYYQGYTELEQTGVVRVDATDANAHAWVEIYLDGQGWRVVDITPPSGVEEPGSNLWEMFVRFLGSGFDSEGASTERTVESETGKQIKQTTQISIGVIGLILVLIILVLVGRQLLLALVRYHRYYHSGRNDRLILRYQKYVRKMGHKKPDLFQKKNYAEQLGFLLDHDMIELSEEEKQKAVRILEHAGFSQAEITEEEESWVKDRLGF